MKEVGLVATASSSGAATFPVTIGITGPQKSIYAGSSATVLINIKEFDDVLAVPSMALRQDDSGTYVYKLVDGNRVKTAIKTGTTFGMQTQVTSGLAEGDVVEIVTPTRSSTGTGNRPGGNFEIPPGGVVFDGGGPSVSFSAPDGSK